VTGSHISPPLFESLQLLGKERSIDRIKAVISK
jgi:glutamyl-tRNA synthetase